MKVGDRIIIGDKQAHRNHYSAVVGMQGFIKSTKNGSFIVEVDDRRLGYNGSGWYIKEIDLLPIATNNKEAAARFLRR